MLENAELEYNCIYRQMLNSDSMLRARSIQ